MTVAQAPATTVAENNVLVSALASDVELLALLHDREPTAVVMKALRECPLEMGLGLTLVSPESRAALAAMRDAVDAISVVEIDEAMDDLAAGYADVYLRYAYRASPSESVWMTDDGLERQAPMFALRELYRQHRLRVTDPAGRPEDHLVLQLFFIAHVLKKATQVDDVAQIARFLDEHLLRWIHRFAGQLVHAGAPDFYAALAVVTATYLDEMRDHLAVITGVVRPSAAEVTSKKGPNTTITVEDRPYVPGVAPSW